MSLESNKNAVMNKMTDSHVNLPQTKQEGTPFLTFHSGAKFKAVQRSLFEGKLDVNIELLQVDRDNGYLCGYITIKDLLYNTDYCQRKFFNGEIIGENYSFETRKWHVTTEIDKEYWGKFPCFKNYPKAFNYEGDLMNYSQLKYADCIYMRWKEVKGVGSEHGIVTPGFYYVCLHTLNGVIEGHYYERYRSDCPVTFRGKYEEIKSTGVFQFR